jgi:membrane fusion protein, multidrug efflux system
MSVTKHRIQTLAPRFPWAACSGIAVLFAVACGGASHAPTGTPPVEVTTAVAEARPWLEMAEITGTLAPRESATLAAEVDGRIIAVHTDLGQTVEEGAPLASLLDDLLRLDVTQAEVARGQAEREYARLSELLATQMVSASDLDSAKSKAEAAKASTELARATLVRAVIRAPWTGQVAQRLVSPGDYVRTGDTLFEFVKVDPIRLQVAVPEVWASRLALGTQIEVVPDTPGENSTFRATIARVGPAVDPVSRTFPIEADIPNPSGVLKAGTFARARIEIGSTPDAVLIPSRAVISAAGVSHSYEIAGGRAVERQVRMLEAVEDTAIVTGVRAGAEIAVRGAARLRDGSPVKVVAVPTGDVTENQVVP